MHRLIAALLAVGLVSAIAPSAGSQEIAPSTRVALNADGDPVQLITGWGSKAAARIKIGKSKAASLFKGGAAGTVTTGHGKTLVALAVDDKKRPFRLFVLDGKDPGKAVGVARPSERSEDYPFAVAATSTPDGFAVFFQEVQIDDPSAAHTYLVLLDKDGKPGDKATEIPVPWALGDAIWNGNGYHLALLYSGDQNGMRLSMVSLSEAGQPEQHPDWASGAGFISDIHLVADDGKIFALYRGGKSGNRLMKSDVTAIRGWGSEPPKAKDLGKLSSGQVIAIAADGKPTRVAAAR